MDTFQIKVIRTVEENEKALQELGALMDGDPQPGTPEGDRLELLAVLIQDFERQAYPMKPKKVPDPSSAWPFPTTASREAQARSFPTFNQSSIEQLLIACMRLKDADGKSLPMSPHQIFSPAVLQQIPEPLRVKP